VPTAVGLPPLTPHGLRHTSPTLVVGSGEPLHAVLKRAPHASNSITADMYAHVPKETEEQGGEVLERLLGG
jgi:integrase